MMSGAPVARFSLTDHHGHKVSEADYSGSFLLIYFGFTHCRVVCPRSLAKLSCALDRLGNSADRITPLYVTVDPARDTPEVMRAYLEASYPKFIGLTGSQEQIDAAKKAFRVFAERKADPQDPDGYAVPHSAISYLMGPDGSYCDHFTDAVEEDKIAERISNALTRERNVEHG